MAAPIPSQSPADGARAIATFCAYRKKLQDIEARRNEAIHPLTEGEARAKAAILEMLEKYQTPCIQVVDPSGERVFIQKKTTNSVRAISENRVVAALDGIVEDDALRSSVCVASPDNIDSVCNLIYDAVRDMCVAKKESVVFTSTPPASLVGRKRKFSPLPAPEAQFDVNSLIQIPDDSRDKTDVVTAATSAYSAMLACRAEAKGHRKTYEQQTQTLMKQKQASEAQVVDFLKSLPSQSQKIKLNAQDAYVVVCRSKTTKKQLKPLRLKQFRVLLEHAIREAIKSASANKDHSTWAYMKLLIRHHLLVAITKFNAENEIARKTEKVYMMPLGGSSGSGSGSGGDSDNNAKSQKSKPASSYYAMLRKQQQQQK